tara:strand:+ start:8770 stop:9426 length:657 start_codon:yes stop_codon:yes gene_type:complete
MPSSFNFLQPVYPELYGIAALAEKLYTVDPSSSIAKARLLAEKTSILIWDFEELDEFSGRQVDRINQLAYRNIIPDIIKGILHTIRTSGNKASHDGTGSKPEALFILKKCFQLSKWFYETYENDYIAETNYQLTEENKLSVKELSEQVDFLAQQVADYKEKIEQLNSSKAVTDSRKKRSERVAKKLNLSEKDTRLTLIDPQLRAAGWEADTTDQLQNT